MPLGGIETGFPISTTPRLSPSSAKPELFCSASWDDDFVRRTSPTRPSRRQKSVEYGAYSRVAQERLRRRARRGSLLRRACSRYGGSIRTPLFGSRYRRDQTDLRPGQPLRQSAQRVLPITPVRWCAASKTARSCWQFSAGYDAKDNASANVAVPNFQTGMKDGKIRSARRRAAQKLVQ